MRTVEATCPRCHATSHYGEELIGRYTLCPSCRCRFYIEVPTLAEAGQQTVVQGPRTVVPPRETSLDDLLWDTQQGSQFIIRSLRRQERRLQQVLLGLAAVAGLVAIDLLLLAFR